jgi:hypothetical protein
MWFRRKSHVMLSGLARRTAKAQMDSAGTKLLQEQAPLRLLKQLTRPRYFILLCFVSATLTQVMTWNDLPSCRDKRSKDVISKIFKERQVDIVSYDEINTVSSADAEILCSAWLTLQDKSRTFIKYKLVKENSQNKLLIINPL